MYIVLHHSLVQKRPQLFLGSKRLHEGFVQADGAGEAILYDFDPLQQPAGKPNATEQSRGGVFASVKRRGRGRDDNILPHFTPLLQRHPRILRVKKVDEGSKTSVKGQDPDSSAWQGDCPGFLAGEVDTEAPKHMLKS